MFQSTLLLTLLLQLTVNVFAISATNAPSLNIFPSDSEVAGLLNSNQSNPFQNSSNVVTYSVERSPITLFLQIELKEIIKRKDLVTALYDSRSYVQERGNGSLASNDDPFNSTFIIDVDCLFTAKSGPLPAQRLTYSNLNDVVQGLMDYTFYPYKTSITGLSFAIWHTVRGFIGTGALVTAISGAERRR